MNEQIEKLSDEAYLFAQSQHSIYSPELLRTYTKKFAELIVRECIDIAYEYDAPKMSGPGMIIAGQIQDHFGLDE